MVVLFSPRKISHVFKRLAIGSNHYYLVPGKKVIHAEEDAMMNIRPNHTKYYIKVRLLVIRIGANANLLNSKPCIRCINQICDIARLLFRRTWPIYMSEADGFSDRRTSCFEV